MNHAYFELAYGATADLMPGTPFTLLNRIAVQKRGQGAGRRLMARILVDADAEGVDLMLSVDPSPGMDEERLRRWYESLGFERFSPEDDNTLVRWHRTGRPCDRNVYWWNGEYDNTCVLDAAHVDHGPHADSINTFFDDDNQKADEPDDAEAYTTRWLQLRSHP